jgi:hypothetical protein
LVDGGGSGSGAVDGIIPERCIVAVVDERTIEIFGRIFNEEFAVLVVFLIVRGRC